MTVSTLNFVASPGDQATGGPSLQNAVQLASGGWLFVYQNDNRIKATYHNADGSLAADSLDVGFGRDATVTTSSDGTVYVAYTSGIGAAEKTAVARLPGLPPEGGADSGSIATPIDLISLNDGPVTFNIAGGAASRLIGLDGGNFAVAHKFLGVFGPDGNILSAVTWNPSLSATSITRLANGKTVAVALVSEGGDLSTLVADLSQPGTQSATPIEIASSVVGSPVITTLAEGRLTQFPENFGFQDPPGTADTERINGSPRYVVTWQTEAGDAMAQVLNRDGSKFFPPFVVAEDASEPAVILQTDQDLVFSYSASDADGSGVYAVRYSFEGGRLSDPVRLNSITEGDQFAGGLIPVAMDQQALSGVPGGQQILSDMLSLRSINEARSGETMIAWTGVGTQPGQSGVFLEHHDTNGNLIATFTLGGVTAIPTEPKLAQLGNGNVIALWSADENGTPQILGRVLTKTPGGYAVAGDGPVVVRSGNGVSLIDVLEGDGSAFVALYGATGNSGTEIRASVGSGDTLADIGAGEVTIVQTGAMTLTPRQIMGQATKLTGTNRGALVFSADHTQAEQQSIFIQTFDLASAAPLEGPLQVNTSVAGQAMNPTVSVVAPIFMNAVTDGESNLGWRTMVVAWETTDATGISHPNAQGAQDTDGSAIVARHVGYFRTGAQTGQLTVSLGGDLRLPNIGSRTETGEFAGEFLVNWSAYSVANYRGVDPSVTIGDQTQPTVTALFNSDGTDLFLTAPVDSRTSYVVSYVSEGRDGDGTSVHFRMFNSLSGASSNSFHTPTRSGIVTVNAQSAGDQWAPVIQPVENGGFRIAFRSQDAATGDARVMAAEFDRFGSIVGDDANQFLVTYTSRDGGGSTDIHARIGGIDGYDDRLAIPAEGLQRSQQALGLLDPVTGAPSGRVVLFFNTFIPDPTTYQAREFYTIFDADGTVIRPSTRLDAQFAGVNAVASLVALPDGGFAMTTGRMLYRFDANGDVSGPPINLAQDALAGTGNASVGVLSDPDGEGPVGDRLFVTYNSGTSGGNPNVAVARIYDLDANAFLSLPDAARVPLKDGAVDPRDTMFHLGAGLPEVVDGAPKTGAEAAGRALDLGDGTSLIGMTAVHVESFPKRFMLRIDNNTGKFIGEAERLGGPNAAAPGAPSLLMAREGLVVGVPGNSHPEVFEVGPRPDAGGGNGLSRVIADAEHPFWSTYYAVPNLQREIRSAVALVDPEDGSLTGKVAFVADRDFADDAARADAGVYATIVDFTGITAADPPRYLEADATFRVNMEKSGAQLAGFASAVARPDGGLTVFYTSSDPNLFRPATGNLTNAQNFFDIKVASFDAEGGMLYQTPSEFEESDVTIVCFLAGTRIATPAGEVPVESLRIGDPVCTADGRVVPVKWMGRQTVRNTPATSALVEPVRIRAGALGPGVPHSDLFVTAGHALIVGDLAITAAALVNGHSIDFVPLADMPEVFDYWHIETDAHEEVLANGAPAETFIDYVARSAFDNHDEYLDLYGDEAPVPEGPRLRVGAQRLIPPDLRACLGIVAQPSEDAVAHLMALARA